MTINAQGKLYNDTMKTYRGSGGIAEGILDLGTRSM
jgi:hypothetical protein